MNETIIIAILLIIALILYNMAIKQRKKARRSRKKIVDKAWRRDKTE